MVSAAILIAFQCRQRTYLGEVPSGNPARHQESDRPEAEAIIAKDRESHQRDLYESIEKRRLPLKWQFQIQLMTEEQADEYRINPFDLKQRCGRTKISPQDVGILNWNCNPEKNYFAEVEQAAFNPQNIVEGIGFPPDKMLQGRLSYGDAQRYRLGVNAEQIPVNKPCCPFHALPS